MIVLQIIIFLFQTSFLYDIDAFVHPDSDLYELASISTLKKTDNNNLEIFSSSNKDNICKFHPFNSDLPLLSFLEPSYWIYSKENITNSLYDEYRNEYGTFRRKSCIYIMLKPEETVQCLNNKNLLLLGDSTSWELKNKFHDDLVYICQNTEECKHIFINFERNYSNYRHYMIDDFVNGTIRYVDKSNNINIYIKFHEPYIENRFGSYIFLPKYMRDEINEKYYKYEKFIVNGTTERWKKAAPFLSKQFDGTTSEKHMVPLFWLVHDHWDEVMHSINGTTMDEYVDIHLKRVRSILNDANVIIYSMQIHDMAFWTFFGWILEEMGDPLSFDFIEHRRIALNNTLNLFHQYENIKYIFWWTSQKPNSDTGDCMFLMDDYDKYHYNTIKILKNVLNANMIFIDTHNVTFGEEKKYGLAYHDGGGCHFSNGNKTQIVGNMFGKIVKNAMCQYQI